MAIVAVIRMVRIIIDGSPSECFGKAVDGRSYGCEARPAPARTRQMPTPDLHLYSSNSNSRRKYENRPRKLKLFQCFMARPVHSRINPPWRPVRLCARSHPRGERRRDHAAIASPLWGATSKPMVSASFRRRNPHGRIEARRSTATRPAGTSGGSINGRPAAYCRRRTSAPAAAPRCGDVEHRRRVQPRHPLGLHVEQHAHPAVRDPLPARAYTDRPRS